MKRIIFCGAQSLFGDIVVYLPLLNYIDYLYPDSFKIYSLARKCAGMAPLLLDNPLINQIKISGPSEGLDNSDFELMKYCEVIYPINPPVTQPDWYNFRNLTQENFRMYGFNDEACARGAKYKPKLYPWFDIPKSEKTIAFYPFVGYTIADPTFQKRSLSLVKAQEIIDALRKEGYKIAQCGHPNSPKLACEYDFTQLTLFESIRMALGCEMAIGSDSGAMHILAAYGMKQICFYTNWRENHITNFEALLPVNYENSLIKLFCKNDINNITPEEVILKTHKL